MKNFVQPFFCGLSLCREERKGARWRAIWRGMSVAILVLFASWASAQGATTLTTNMALCGATKDVRCISVPIADGGSLWIQWLSRYGAYQGFIQFSPDGPDDLAGTTSAMSASYSLGQYESITPSQGNPQVSIEYVLTIHSFSGRDSNGKQFSGEGSMKFHYVYTRGSGRGGGGAGWHLVEDGGTITLN